MTTEAKNRYAVMVRTPDSELAGLMGIIARNRGEAEVAATLIFAADNLKVENYGHTLPDFTDERMYESEQVIGVVMHEGVKALLCPRREVVPAEVRRRFKDLTETGEAAA